MPPPSSHITLISQSFVANGIPASEGTISEAARLHAALCCSYEYKLLLQWSGEISSGMLYNQLLTASSPSSGDQPGDEAQFKVDAYDIETGRVLTVESMNEHFSLQPITVLPLDANWQPIEFQLIENGPAKRTILYGNEDLFGGLQVTVNNINVIDAQFINLGVWNDSMPMTRFNEPLFFLLDRSEAFRIDLLHASPTEPCTLVEHLQTLFDHVFGGKPGCLIKFGCSYRYQPAAGMPEYLLPVLLIPSDHYDEDFAQGIAPALKAWYENTEPQAGSFVFALTVFTVISEQTLPVLILRELILPIAAISDLKVVTDA